MATTDSEQLTAEELQLATRNHGMPLEALRYDVTPVGLHYLLIHYDIPIVDADTWRLTIDGTVAQPIELTLDDLRALPPVTQAVTMECAGNGRAHLLPRPLSQPWLNEAIGTGQWTGARVSDVIARVGLLDGTVELVFSGLDRGLEGGVAQRYERSLAVADALRPEVILAYELNGAPLPPQHGFPVRLLVPGWYGMTSVKWLGEISAVDLPFEGYQQTVAYRYRQQADQPGEPVKRIAVRSLIAPPGVPDFYTRRRVVGAGPVQVTGRAWSGEAHIATVEVSTDDGTTWAEAEVASGVDQFAWAGWRFAWDATPGEHVLVARATDAAGNRQPDTPAWNLGGYAVNAVHRVPVSVT